MTKETGYTRDEENISYMYTLPEPDRKPLTDESIVAMWHQPVLALAALEFARAIERAHGIKENT